MQSNLKVSLKIGLSICSVMVLSACGGGTTSELSSASGVAQHIDLSNSASVFVSKSDVGSTSSSSITAQSTNRIKRLKRETLGGSIEDVSFLDRNGHQVSIEVIDLVALNDAYFALEFRENNALHTRRVLVRKSDGKLFDLQAYTLANAQAKGPYLFAWDAYGSVLNRIDPDRLTATPLNNPTTIAASSGSSFLIDNQYNIQLWTGSGTTYSNLLFFDNSPPYSEASSDAASCPNGGAAGELSRMYGEDGQIYLLCLNDLPVSGQRQINTFFRRLNFTTSGIVYTDSAPLRTVNCTNGDANPICPDAPIRAKTTYRLSDRHRFVLTKNGYFTLSPIAGGGIESTFTAKSMSEVPLTSNYGRGNPEFSDALIAGDSVYWKTGNSIQRLVLNPSSTSQTMVTDSNLIGFKVISGAVVYTKYVTGTQINTYRVRNAGDTPELIASDDMEIEQIINF